MENNNLNCTNADKSSQAFNVILTGATGFVGRHLARELLSRGTNVTALVRDENKAAQIRHLEGCKLIQMSLSADQPTFPVVKSSTLFHCAWPDVRDTTNSRHIEEHFISSYKFIKKGIESGIKKVIITGSLSEYGLQYGPVSIHTVPQPNTPYALAKVTLYQALKYLSKSVNFQLSWARLFYIYGEGQSDCSVVPLFDAALDRGERSFNMSNGDQLLDYLPVEVAASRLSDLLNYKEGLYNICSGEPISLRRFLENRMKEKNKQIHLNLGYYDYRKQDSLAIWGSDPFKPIPPQP